MAAFKTLHVQQHWQPIPVGNIRSDPSHGNGLPAKPAMQAQGEGEVNSDQCVFRRRHGGGLVSAPPVPHAGEGGAKRRGGSGKRAALTSGNATTWLYLERFGFAGAHGIVRL